ncbi:hypothetical protein [Aliarcobacter cryaerophilus]|uniref:Uncharacterized protein n=1 Tax=Aliarcobacter cryaerophilus TaxID=28198 RepID=A0AA46N5Q8_9BACT|nr:hypothetical protein [Aliarcobacter cryaerophilus]UYF42405.1 hypothetical protein NGX11_05710 [Aliarcobacter cryaerophilus]
MDINKAKKKDNNTMIEAQTKLFKYKNELKHYKKMYEESLNRELMYLEKIDKLEKTLKINLPTNNNVLIK